VLQACARLAVRWSTPLTAPAPTRMFGQARPVVFDPHRHRRARWGVPRWLVLLLLGLATGAGGVLYLQQRVLPPRLSIEDSQRLQAAFGAADAERNKLQQELATLKRQLEVATAESRRRDDELSAARAAVASRARIASTIALCSAADCRGRSAGDRAR